MNRGSGWTYESRGWALTGVSDDARQFTDPIASPASQKTLFVVCCGEYRADTTRDQSGAGGAEPISVLRVPGPFSSTLSFNLTSSQDSYIRATTRGDSLL